MVPDPTRWYWCLVGVYAFAAIDTVADVMSGASFTLKQIWDVAWAFRGGTVGDAEYWQWLYTCNYEIETVNIPPMGDVEVVTYDLSWWNAVIAAIATVPPAEQKCNLPQWD